MLIFLNNLFINTPSNEKSAVDEDHIFAKGLTKLSLAYYSLLIILSIVTGIVSKSVMFQMNTLYIALMIYFTFINYFGYLKDRGIGDNIKLKKTYRIFIQFAIIAVFILADIELFIKALQSIINGAKYGFSVWAFLLILITLALHVYIYMWTSRNVDNASRLYSENRRIQFLSLLIFGVISVIYLVIGLLKLPVADGIFSIVFFLYIGYLIYTDLAFRLIPEYTDHVGGENENEYEDTAETDEDTDVRPVRNVRQERRARRAPDYSDDGYEEDAIDAVIDEVSEDIPEDRPAKKNTRGRTRERERYVRKDSEEIDGYTSGSEEQYQKPRTEPARKKNTENDYPGLTPKERTIRRLQDLVKDYDERFESSNYVIEQQGINLFIMFDVVIPNDVPESNIEVKLALNRHIQRTYPSYISDIKVIREY